MKIFLDIHLPSLVLSLPMYLSLTSVHSRGDGKGEGIIYNIFGDNEER
jgi:hypothetical protein